MKLTANECREIYEKHAPMVRGLLFRMSGKEELDDQVQETFIKIFQKMEEFKGESELKTWIYKIALNTGRDYLRAKKRKTWLQFFGFETPDQVDLKPNPEVALRENQEAMRLVNALSPKLKEVLVLFSLEELSLQEVSQILGIPEGTVKSRLNLAKKSLSETLTKEVLHE